MFKPWCGSDPIPWFASIRASYSATPDLLEIQPLGRDPLPIDMKSLHLEVEARLLHYLLLQLPSDRGQWLPTPFLEKVGISGPHARHRCLPASSPWRPGNQVCRVQTRPGHGDAQSSRTNPSPLGWQIVISTFWCQYRLKRPGATLRAQSQGDEKRDGEATYVPAPILDQDGTHEG
jgi:hypothetical protein